MNKWMNEKFYAIHNCSLRCTGPMRTAMQNYGFGFKTLCTCAKQAGDEVIVYIVFNLNLYFLTKLN